MKRSLAGLITLGVSLIISVVSAYCTVSGFGKVFASAAITTMVIASVIELGRVVLTYVLHHYWSELPLNKKIPGIGMLCVAVLLSSMGIFGFLANAHSQRTQDIIPIEMEIDERKSQIEILSKSISANNEQISQIEQSFNSEASNKAFEKYVEINHITKAVNMKREQLNSTKPLYAENTEYNKEINSLQKEILTLQLDAEKKAPTLAHLKYYAQLFGVSNDASIIIFIVLIMMVFDTLAMYLMVASDWIFVFEDKKRQKGEEHPMMVIPVKAETRPLKSDYTVELGDSFFDNVVNTKNENDEVFKSQLNDIKAELDVINEKNKTQDDENIIDEDTEKLLSLITEDKNVIYNSNFQKYLKENKYTGKKILKHVDDSVKVELNKILN